MGKYDARLSQLTQSPIIARLEGPGGLLALSSRELFYLDDNTSQSSRLSIIKRISVNKQTGTIDVMSEQGILMSIAPAAFQKDELKLFLESLKGHVLRAKSEATQTDEPPRVVESVETPPPTPDAAREASVPPPSPPTPQPTYPTPPETPPVAPAFSNQLNITEPAKTLPDEPSDSIWAYEGSPKPSSAAPVPAPAPTPTATDARSEASPAPKVSAQGRGPSSTQRVISVLLKVSALITAGVTGGYLVVNMGSTSDIWVPLGVISVGLSLALIQWRLSEPY